MRVFLSSLLLISICAQAEVPNVFTPKTPAKAGEVNENFAYLESRINQATGVSDGEGGDTPTIQCFNNNVDVAISYSSKTAPLGTQLYLGSEEYRLAKFRVEDANTKKLYDITMPIKFYGAAVRASGSMIELGSSLVCEDARISDFPLANSKNIGVSYSNYYTYNSDSSASSYRTKTVSTQFSIALGESLFHVSYSAKKESSKSTIVQGDYDLSDNYITFDPDMSSYVTDIDNLIDYIQVQQVAP